jgi:hypothetical protein
MSGLCLWVIMCILGFWIAPALDTIAKSLKRIADKAEEATKQ